MDPTTFPAAPAPFWFVELFKCIGFFLHLIPMHLWFAGLAFAIFTFACGGPTAKRFSRRMFGQLPIFLALGVNFAIVPLLFLQTTYYKQFYTATILTAWFWLAVIPLFLFAYYAIYAGSFSVKRYTEALETPTEKVEKSDKKKDVPKSETKNTTKNKAASKAKWQTLFFEFCAWCFLLGVGVLISHGLNLMGRSEIWDDIWSKTQISGAVLGLGHHFVDPLLWSKFLSMFGLALLTTAVWTVFDSHALISSQSDQDVAYRKWTIPFAARIAWLGVIVSLCSFVYYFWRLDAAEDMKFLFQFPWCAAPILMIVLPLVPAVLLTQSGRSDRLKGKAFAGVMVSQILLLASFVVTRQWIQNVEFGRFVRVDQIPTEPAWTAMIAFLITFLFGAGIIFWIVRQVVICPPKTK